MANYNRAAAFVEYCRGSSLEDISLALAVPMNYLKRWAHEEMWHMLAPMQKQSNALVPSNEGQLQRITENRERNLDLAIKLREDLTKQVDLLLKGELVCEKITSKGVRVQYDPGVAERREIAQYAKEVADLTYRALGDVIVSGTKSAGAGGESGSQNITIVLPGAVAQPRHEISYDIESQVVSLPKPVCLPRAEESVFPAPADASPYPDTVCADQKAPCDSVDLIARDPKGLE